MRILFPEPLTAAGEGIAWQLAVPFLLFYLEDPLPFEAYLTYVTLGEGHSLFCTFFSLLYIIGFRCFPINHSFPLFMQAVVSAIPQNGKPSSYHASRWPCIPFHA